MRKLVSMAGMIGAMAALAAVPASPAMTIVVEDREERKRERAPTPQRVSLNRGASRLNRSRHWDYAATYKDARAISPFPLNPIR